MFSKIKIWSLNYNFIKKNACLTVQHTIKNDQQHEKWSCKVKTWSAKYMSNNKKLISKIKKWSDKMKIWSAKWKIDQVSVLSNNDVSVLSNNDVSVLSNNDVSVLSNNDVSVLSKLISGKNSLQNLSNLILVEK